MTRTRTPHPRPSGRRVLGALTSAAAVALVGVAALPPATAAAAGVADDHPRLLVAGQDPAALPTATSTRAATYRWDGTRFVATTP
ncbi:hypothetical protein [Phycicoccus avicenniae]|uniref:hypothetical protein n=1 Tax=Phycicoccus avicenniae TaxID=2828860 RepID=UPI003D2D8491